MTIENECDLSAATPFKLRDTTYEQDQRHISASHGKEHVSTYGKIILHCFTRTNSVISQLLAVNWSYWGLMSHLGGAPKLILKMFIPIQILLYLMIRLC
jgi:hypothetical protein